MTSTSFERLLYTDCRAGEGRGGAVGFQVQAESAGVAPDQERMAISWLLYAAQDSWIVERRPVEDFPLGFAHSAAAGFGTGQSRYLGDQVTGGRAGNHLADCLMTTNAELYGAIRPAQLWRSDLWRATAWDRIDCPPYDGFLEPGPLTTDALADWLRAAPHRATVLVRLVSTLEQAEGPKVVITADDPEDAMRWIAAATLLIPMRLALLISFKVFVNNLQQAAQRIAAVPKALNPQVRPGRGDARFILDASNGMSDKGAVSTRAAYWVERLATADDPYDVVDAVELADTLGGHDDRSEADTRETAWALTATAEPVGRVDGLIRWLTNASPENVDRHGAFVASRILEGDAGAEALQWIDRQASVGRLHANRALTRSKLLTAEIERARLGIGPPTGVLEPVEFDPNIVRDAESQVASALVLGTDAEVDLLLRIARRHRIELPLVSLLERLHAFGAAWVRAPEVNYRPDEWALRDPILDLLHAELSSRLREGGRRTVLHALTRVWPLLHDRSGDLNERLNWELHAAALSTAPPEERYARVRMSFASVGHSGVGIAALVGMQQAMLDWGVIGEYEAMAIVSALPLEVELDARIARMAATAASARVRQPDLLVLSTLDRLDRRMLLPRGHHVDELLRSQRSIRRLVDDARRIHIKSEIEQLRDPLTLMRNVDPLVTRHFLPELLGTALHSRVPELGSVFLRFMHDPLPLRFLDCWARELAGRDSIIAGAVAVTWYEDGILTEETRAKIAAEIGAHCERLDNDRRDRWITAVQSRLSSDQQRTWLALVRPDDTRQRRGRWSRERGD